MTEERIANIEKTLSLLQDVVGNGDAMGPRFKERLSNFLFDDVPDLISALQVQNSVTRSIELLDSCPQHLMDGRNEIRCWLELGHEGPHK